MEAARQDDFGALLRRFRLEAGITQQELAERARLSMEAISTLERGARTRPHRETVILLSRALKLPPERRALLESAAHIPHPPRRRESSEALKASLIRIVRTDGQATPKHNLPAHLSSFVGREREVAEIAALLHDHRVVTIVGAGGIGKSRVALRIGSDLLDNFPDGVWLVDLAPMADQTLVASAVLTALQHSATTGSALDVVVAYLKTRHLILILDNCEHVISAAREVATTIIGLCPHVRILTTSREALDEAGERVYRLPSMAVPPDAPGTAQDALRYGAVTLFVERAHAVNSSFALLDDNAPDVSEICRRLDGIPLAIELAAARVKVLAPRQIARRLDQRFHLLTGGDSRALPRHQTMTALIDWSYGLLTVREQKFFEALSVFAGDCSLEAITAVCAADDEDDVAVIDLITSLVTKSLLVAELASEEQRYRLLESSRQYARDKLIACGKLDDFARRHAIFYVELAEQREREWDAMPDRAWLPQASLEVENWRAALEWTLARSGDVALGQRLAAVRAVMWRSFTLAEGRRWVRAAMELVHDDTPALVVAQLKHAEAEGARRFGDFKMAFTNAESALLRFRKLGDARGIAETQSLAGVMLSILGRPEEAEPLLREALEAAETLGDRRLRATALFRLGLVRAEVADYTGAGAYLTEALGLAKVLGAAILGESVRIALAQNEHLTGNAEKALQLIEDVLADKRSGNAVGTSAAYCLTDRATYLIALSRYDEAQAQANDALIEGRDSQLDFVVARSLHQLAVIALLRPALEHVSAVVRYAGAARLFGFAKARFTSLGSLEDLERQYYLSALGRLHETIVSDKLTHLMAAGATMTEDEAIDQAHALEGDFW
jgi:predicted ATPase/transcriptional regulator with XRE-family HTH domain